MKTVSTQDAEGQLDELIDLAAKGEKVAIAKNRHTKAMLVPAPSTPRRKRRFGQYQGKIRMSADFNDPLPEQFWLGNDL